MLESLCVLSVIAALLIVTFSQYRSQRMETNYALVRSDVQLLSQALRAYVQKTGCYEGNSDDRGYFSGSDAPALSDLETATLRLPTNREPIVEAYRVAIEDTLNTEKEGPRVRHRLLVKVELSTHYKKQASSVAALLGATMSTDNADTLEWSVPMVMAENASSSASVLAFVRRWGNQDNDDLSHVGASLAACWLGEEA